MRVFGRKIKENKTKILVCFLSFLMGLLVLGAVHYTIAFLSGGGQKINTFTIGDVGSQITESFTVDANGDWVKENVAVTNTGSVQAYIRAAVTIYWADKNGSVILAGKPQEGVDYQIEWNPQWLPIDGFYYYPAPVEKDATTDSLINFCKQIKQYSDQRGLVVDISVQAIQAEPIRAAASAWNVVINETTKYIEQSAGAGGE